jgi:hypothetical protein
VTKDREIIEEAARILEKNGYRALATKLRGVHQEMPCFCGTKNAKRCPRHVDPVG